MVYYGTTPLRGAIPTVLVRLSTDDGEIAFRARWKESARALHNNILFRIRQGHHLWFEDDRGRNLCFKPEYVWGAVVDGR